ncbi:ParB/RepB/Spo0J family partition protein [Syntrophomonas palmitatica]|uniref:ParB/RepB/Spo0J family partition protein n=1 Tax=Syntrophomonas palmitatica TaxID=402877 RepID=UPI0006D05D8E|nr:ParB/RepB/Spo0J family partition protein [Syntrophomonas palmitatica]
MVGIKLDRLIGREKTTAVCKIPLDQIRPNPFNPRQEYTQEELLQLAQSIKNHGIIQPIIVRPHLDGCYQVVCGERRFRACCLLGMSAIPAVVQEMEDEKAAVIGIVDNMHRQNLNYFEEARAYHILAHKAGLKQEDIARKTGRSQANIVKKLRLLLIPDRVRAMISTDIIAERQVQSLLKLTSAEAQMEVINRIYEQELSPRESEALVEKLSQNNLPQENRTRFGGQNVSVLIRDTRIFFNTIKETVKRARQTGVDISLSERDGEEEYEIVIRVNKTAPSLRMAAPG